MKKNKILLLVALFYSGNIFSQTIAKYAGEFMAIGVGGRALGMGGAQTALVNDVTAAYWNPAGLAKIDYPQFALMHEERFGNLINYNYAAFAIPYKDDLSFAVSAIRLSIDGIPDTRNALVDLDGKIITDISSPNAGLDPSKIKEFSNTDWAFYFSFAKRQSDKLFWGANVKLIQRNIAEYTATGIGFDVGAFYKPSEKIMLGASLMDATTTIVAWSEGRTELITPTLKLGAAYSIEFFGGVLLPAVDVDMRFEGREFASYFNLGPVSFDTHTGLEYGYKNLILIRAGYNDVKQFTIGAGINLPKLQIDYSFASFSGNRDETLDDSHRISLLLTLEELKYKRGN
ncbi:MAG: PorV/PorQ family protein [Bacteroidetes bacterium]|nr:PorV/PorQ family protein [Bacteroidota bacterium]MBU2507722.1 PorV/PorQ family protein [Bacteroidota bacterium]